MHGCDSTDSLTWLKLSTVKLKVASGRASSSSSFCAGAPSSLPFSWLSSSSPAASFAADTSSFSVEDVTVSSVSMVKVTARR